MRMAPCIDAKAKIRITNENVQHIGECISLSAIKKMMRFAHHPRSLDKLYAGLVEDIYGNRGYNTTFSDGYDLASEVICFLCHYMGHDLDDLACQNRRGDPSEMSKSFGAEHRKVEQRDYFSEWV